MVRSCALAADVQPFKVEVAAKHTPAAPFNNYVTLEYVPLRSEQ
jgi:hypothetical protein